MNDTTPIDHNDQAFADELTPAPLPDPPQPAPPPVAHLQLAVLDVDWPDKANRKFAVELPQPAFFQRAYAADIPSPILGGRRKPVLRMVWMVNIDGPTERGMFIVQHENDVMLVPANGTGPQLLTTVLGPEREPVALWRMRRPALASVPAEVAPERTSIIETLERQPQ